MNDDDAEEKDDGTAFDAGGALRTSSDAAGNFRFNGGTRFTSVTIGQGDTIDSATWSVLARFAATQRDMNADILAEDVDNAVDFATTADVTSRARTGASVQWTENALSDTVFNGSPEIKTVVQEVIDRGSWSSGNALVILGDGKTDITKASNWESHDHDNAQAAKLDIDYTPAGFPHSQAVII